MVLCGFVTRTTAFATTTQPQMLPQAILNKLSKKLPPSLAEITTVVTATNAAISNQKTALSTIGPNLINAQKNLALAQQAAQQAVSNAQAVLNQAAGTIQQETLVVQKIAHIIKRLSEETGTPPLTSPELTTIKDFTSDLQKQSDDLQQSVIPLNDAQRSISLAVQQLTAQPTK